ncbi:MAG: AAA family ATPase, partial [Bacteroidales bacterium]|nr:AAA family ATPase [Bacteroidales bacterium]
MYLRRQQFEDSAGESFFLWGARQTGKSTLLKKLYPGSLWFDLLLNDVFERFQRNPSQVREIIIASQPKEPVVIDEIQKIPALLDEIHWLIENTQTRL